MKIIRDPMTVVGNGIDRSMARGIARRAIQEARDRASHLQEVPMASSLGCLKSRQRHLQRIIRAAGVCAIGSVTTADRKKAKVSCLSAMELTPEWVGVGVFGYHYNMDMKALRQQIQASGHAKIDSFSVDAFIDQHALQRLAQRRGDRELDTFLDSLSTIWGWCHVANEENLQGVFYVPTRDGLICCERSAFPDVTWMNPEAGHMVNRVVTYLSLDIMSPEILDSWRRLTNAGLHRMSPRYPRLSRPSEEERSGMAALHAEGKIWQRKRDHAREIEATQETTNLDGDGMRRCVGLEAASMPACLARPAGVDLSGRAATAP